MERLYLPLKLSGPNDKDGFKKMDDYRKDVAAHRVAVNKAHKREKAFFLEQGRKIDAEKNRLVGRIQRIESHLIDQCDIRRKEQQRQAEEADRLRKEKIQHRIETVINCGAVFNGLAYVYGENTVSHEQISMLNDEHFDLQIEKINEWRRLEEERQAIEAQRQKEAEEKRAAEEVEFKEKQEAFNKKQAEQEDRENKIREEQEKIEEEKRRIENEKQLKIAKEAAEKAAAKRIEEEKEAARLKKIEDDKRHAAEMEQAKKDAAEAAIKEQKRLAAEKAEKERKAKAAEEKKARLAPDKNKLEVLADYLETVEGPTVKDPDAKKILKEALNLVAGAVDVLRTGAKEL